MVLKYSCGCDILKITKAIFKLYYEVKIMDNEKLIKLLSEFIGAKPLDMDKIPDIDLYMDQVTTFIEDQLADSKRQNEDKLLTKTMINNYTKAGLIPPPVKKKYTKNHLISLIMIYYLKSVLSINDIKCVLNAIGEDNIETTYEQFIDLQKNEISFVNTSTSKQVMDILPKDISDERTSAILAVLILTIGANYRKQIAEKIIDTYLQSEK